MFFPLKDENPTKTFPYMTILLIIINTIIFIVELSFGRYRNYVVAGYGVIPFEITHAVDIDPKVPLGPYITLITSLFLHGSFWHLAGNMWFLWIFGNNIEDIVGHSKFLMFYMLGGIAASFLQILVNPSSSIPVIGASGAISAILGAYILKFPRARIKTLLFLFIFITVINVPAVTFIGIWFLFQLFSGVSGSASNVAFYAHIGGFLFGLFTIKLFQKKSRHTRYKVY